MKITVQLRVVGVYYNRPITFDGGANPTVGSVMSAAQSQYPIASPEGFDFVSTLSTNPSIVSISHNFPGSYDYDGNGVTTDSVDGPTLGGSTLPAGIYQLTEQLIDGGLIGWQYYVVRGNIVVSATPPSRGFDSYANFPVKDGDKVIWRLVAIAKDRVGKKSRYERLS